jgi:anti-sigma factor RsiW
MKCTDVRDLAPLYLTGELESARAEQLAAHVKFCPPCAVELGQQEAFDSLLRESLLAEHFDSSRVESKVRQSITRLSRRRWTLALAGAAALFLLLLGVRTVMSSRTIPVYAAAAQDHRMEIVDRQPRKWFTDRPSIEELARRQGVSGSSIDAIAPAGYHLAQGKLCRLDGKIFLHLVYANDSESLSVFLRPTDGISAVHSETQGAEHVAGFQDRAVSALVVTEQSGDAALRFARSAAAVI